MPNKKSDCMSDSKTPQKKSTASNKVSEVQCTINGAGVKVPQGSTIIQAYHQLNKDIAHYCWHPGLSIAGVCRLCMVEIEGFSKLQIACNTLVEEGMVITNQSKQVKDTVRWGLEFHLINHPLDCPICDQAGECALQEQYMKFGNYDPLMAENKVKKRKVVDLGSKIVLDTERCILCTRCTRFTDEVSKTKELGIFNRGDHSEIGIFKDKPLENDYALNTVDICPVGALTSKKFRFQQRVWYLQKTNSICTGCSTACNTTLEYNEEGVWRILPRHNKEINGHWMCDKGRETFQHINKNKRALKSSIIHQKKVSLKKTSEVLKDLQQTVIEESADLKKAGLVLTGQYTCEEYEDFLSFFSKTFPSGWIYHWKNNAETFDFFDGFLIRGDKNPNTYGLMTTMEQQGLSFQSWSHLMENIENGSLQTLFVCGPENPALFPKLNQHLTLFLKAQNLIWMAPHHPPALNESDCRVWAVSLKTYFEKSGTFINYKGRKQKIKKAGLVVEEAFCLQEIACILQNRMQFIKPRPTLDSEMKENHFLKQRGPI